MSPEELVVALIAAGDQAGRQALLVPREGDYYTAVVDLLKDRVDQERLRDPLAALELARLAADVAAFAGHPRCRAVAAWAQANARFHQGHFHDCLALYEQAAAFYTAAGDEIDAARLAANRAWALKNLGRYDEGVSAVQEALVVLRQHPPSRFLASTLNGLGTLHRLLGQPQEALVAYREAEAIYVTLDDPISLARLRVNKANTLRSIDLFAPALTLFQEARAVLLRGEMAVEVARVDLNLGILYARLARYDEALAALDQAGEAFAVLENEMEAAVVELHRADLYARFNLYDELLQIAPRWRILKEHGLQRHAAHALLHQAVAWRHLGNTARAGQLAGQAEAIYRRIGAPVPARLASLERAAQLCRLGDWEQARRLALEAAVFLEGAEMPLRAAAGHLLAVECDLALDEPAAAGRRCERVLALALSLGVSALRYQALHGLGRVAWRQGRRPQAGQYLRQAIDILEEMRSGLRVEDLRLGFLEDKIAVYRDAVLLYLEQGQEENAFALAERAKSGALVDLLQASLERRPAPAVAAGRDLLVRLDALRQELNWQIAGLEEGGGGERGGACPPPEASVWESIAAVEREMMRIWRALQQAVPLYASLADPERGRASTLRRFLGEDTLFVQYFLDGQGIQAFLVDRGGLRACRRLTCTLAGVEDALGALESSLHAVSSLNLEGNALAGRLQLVCREQLAWLYQALLAPLSPYLSGYRRLVIAPDGPLFQVPFHALHDGWRYLIDRFEVAYIPSAGTLGLCHEHGRQGYRRRQALILGCARSGRLTQVETEVDAVAQALPGARVLTGNEASLARLRAEAGQSRVLHLASHALYRHDNPLFSAVQLAGGEWLRALDLYGLPLTGALVTLSGCDTGRHRLLGGDLLGLGRGFLVAGAAALVSSLWPVDDEATACLMTGFYERLARGQTVAAALRAGQRALRDGQFGPDYAHPAFWAAFCLLGDPDLCLDAE